MLENYITKHVQYLGEKFFLKKELSKNDLAKITNIFNCNDNEIIAFFDKTIFNKKTEGIVFTKNKIIYAKNIFFNINTFSINYKNLTEIYFGSELKDLNKKYININSIDNKVKIKYYQLEGLFKKYKNEFLIFNFYKFLKNLNILFCEEQFLKKFNLYKSF